MEKFLGIIAALSTNGERGKVAVEISADRRLKFEAARERLRQLINSSKKIVEPGREILTQFSGDEHDPSSFTNWNGPLANIPRVSSPSSTLWE